MDYLPRLLAQKKANNALLISITASVIGLI